MQSSDYEIIAVLGIVMDFLALLFLAAFPYSPADGIAVSAFFIFSPLCFLAFTALLHGAARILEIENRRLLFSAFIAFTSFIIFLAVARVIYQKTSIVFAICIMWIMAAGMAKFMYRTHWSKAFLVSSPLFVVFLVLIIRNYL